MPNHEPTQLNPDNDPNQAERTCPFCKYTFTGWGNNPEPVLPWESGKNACCDDCNSTVVIPARLTAIFESRKVETEHQLPKEEEE
jgi:hypothetical protein